MKKNYYFYYFLAILFIIQILIISPKGNFPLNDDWAHTLTIFHYLQNKEIFYPTWLSSFQYPPIIYGIILGKIFGFSFTILRLSNIILSFLTICLFFYFLRQNKIKFYTSAIISLIFYFNPLFFYLTNTFMGDIFALFILLLASNLYQAGFRQVKNYLLFLASIISLIGAFDRQFIIFLLPAGAISFYLLNKKRDKKFFLNSFFIFVLPLFLAMIIYYYLSQKGLVPGEVSARFLPNTLSYTKHFSQTIWHYALLISFFILPITIGILAKNTFLLRTKKFWLTIFFFCLFFCLSCYYQQTFPKLGNIINLYGLGPTKEIMQGNLNIWGKNYFYTILNFILSLSTGANLIIIHYFWKNFQPKIESSIFFFFIFSGMYFVLILPIRTFDRYLLILLPIFFFILAKIITKLNYQKYFLLFTFLPIIFYSYLGVYNYFQWNKIRWQLGEYLLEQKITPEKIDGGYEWNGWNLYYSTQNKPLGEFTPSWAPWYIKEIFPGHLMPYIISFSPLGGYEVIKKERVKTFLSPIDYLYINKGLK